MMSLKPPPVEKRIETNVRNSLEFENIRKKSTSSSFLLFSRSRMRDVEIATLDGLVSKGVPSLEGTETVSSCLSFAS
jgi:hypothetical protein